MGRIFSWLTAILLAVFFLPGCPEEGSFWVTVIFPDDEARSRTSALAVYAIEPDAGAGCDALLQASALPGESGYAVEDQITFRPGEESQGTLEQVGPGERLFFVEARDSGDRIILRGCTPAEAGGGGMRSVRIELVWTCIPTNGGVEICDDLDNDCDGDTDEGDPVHLCPEVPQAEASACSDGRCSYACLPGWYDTNQDWADGCECLPSRQGEEWCDGLDNDCDGVTDGPGCIACQSDADCVDPASCLEGTCDQGACTTEASPDGRDCDDGLFCTQDDACQDGVCRGVSRDCSVLDDTCNRGVCDEEQDACVAAPLEDGTECDDGAWCTLDDICSQGVCQGSPRDCSRLDEPCRIGVCNEEEKSCEAQPKVNGAPCDDGLFCTVEDSCLDGDCTGQTRDCSASGTGCVDGVCSEEQQACVGDPLPAGTFCDDELFCTVNDVCDGEGNCAGQARDCSHLSGQCALGVCDEEQDTCLATPDNEAAGCDDGLFCTVGETCRDGACTGGEPRDCSHLDGPCVQGTCDEQEQDCVASLLPENTDCDDGVGCTAGDVCDTQGNCAGQPDDGLCTAGQVCAPACSPSPDGCMAPPALQVDCPASVAGSATTQCAVDTGGIEGQAGCLHCTAYLRPLEDVLDFSLDGDASVCDLDGWTLAAEPCNHPDKDGGCPLLLDQLDPDCCTDLLCPVQNGAYAGRVALEADGLACSLEEWRLSRTFDLRPFDQADIAFAHARTGTGTANSLQLQVDEGTDPEGDILYCAQPGDMPPGHLEFERIDLPPVWLTGSATRLTFWLHAEPGQSTWLLDEVRLIAWEDVCPDQHDWVFTESFYPCNGDLDDGYHDWSVSGSPDCGVSPCGTWTLTAHAGETWSIEHLVDTTPLSGTVELCWTLGDTEPCAADFMAAFDTGSGFQSAYQASGDLLPGDNSCTNRMCVDLAALDPAAAQNPALHIRFSVAVTTGEVYFDSVVVRGDGRCNAPGQVEAGTVTAQGGGMYAVELSVLDADAHHVELVCDWSAGSGPATSASDTVLFVP